MSIAAHSATPSNLAEPSVPAESIFRLSVEQYHEMIRAGILTPDDHVELLAGWLIQKMSKNLPHRIATRLAADVLIRAIPTGWYVDSQEPMTTGTSEPEPDIAVIRGSTRDYANRNPSPAEAAIVIEVADSSIIRDRGIKLRIYARANVPVYWIINLNERQVEIYTHPSGPVAQPGYGEVKIYTQAESVPVVIDGKVISQILISDILP